MLHSIPDPSPNFAFCINKKFHQIYTFTLDYKAEITFSTQILRKIAKKVILDQK